jgi:hypothetical protein
MMAGSRREAPEEHAAVSGAEGNLVARGGEADGHDGIKVLARLRFGGDSVQDCAGRPVDHGHGAGIAHPVAAYCDPAALVGTAVLVRRQGQGVEGAALFAPGGPAQHGPLGGLKLAVRITPNTDDLVVADREEGFTVGTEREGVAGSRAPARFQHQLGVAAVPAVVLGQGAIGHADQSGHDQTGEHRRTHPATLRRASVP